MTRFKIMIEKTMLYRDIKKVLDKIDKLGFEITFVDNGNIFCDLGDEDGE